MGQDDEFDIRERCAQCGERVTTTVEAQQFPYGVDGPDQVMLTAAVPVRHCAACGFDYTDEEGANARGAAVSAHLAGQKRDVHFPPQDGIDPHAAFSLLMDEVSRACADAAICGIGLVRCPEGSDDIAEVEDYGGPYPKCGLTISACEIEGKSIARRLLTPGYSLAWIGPGPNDPQDGYDSVEVGEFYCAEDVADEVIRQIVNYRLQRAVERRGEGVAALEADDPFAGYDGEDW